MSLSKVMVITKNRYLKNGLEKIIDSASLHHALYIIDVDSFASLRLLTESVKDLDDVSQVLLIANIRGYFTFLAHLIWIDNAHSVESLKKQISSAVIMTVGMLKQHINILLSLCFLTKKEVEICSLCCRFDIHITAKIINRSVKTVYHILDMATHKMNYKSMSYLLFFIINEFGTADLFKVAGLYNVNNIQNDKRFRNYNRFTTLAFS